MKFVAISDMHGHLIDVPQSDVLLIAGDILPWDNHEDWYQSAWLASTLGPWLQNIADRGTQIIACAGNHDFVFQRNPGLVPDKLPWTYLEDSGTEIDGIKIWGTPWQPIFGGWAFNADDHKLQMAFDLVPDDTDIIVAHGPPYGQGDKTGNYEFSRGANVGSVAMMNTIKRVQPDYMVCGHIHPAYGWYRMGKTHVLNAAVVNARYQVAHKPLEFSLDKSE